MAESEGRLPRSRAAKYLGVSVAAFDAGCRAANYRSSEWHHVGKYAAMIDYFDCEELADDQRFWDGAAIAYKSAKKRAEVLGTMARREEEARQARVEAFRQKLIQQRDCTRAVERHSARAAWQNRCFRAQISGVIPVGDLEALRLAIAERDARRAERERKTEEKAELNREIIRLLFVTCSLTTDDFGRACFTLDGNMHFRPHQGGINTWCRKGGTHGWPLKPAEFLAQLRKKVGHV